MDQDAITYAIDKAITKHIKEHHTTIGVIMDQDAITYAIDKAITKHIKEHHTGFIVMDQPQPKQCECESRALTWLEHHLCCAGHAKAKFCPWCGLPLGGKP